jgi:hypothetical protein
MNIYPNKNLIENKRKSKRSWISVGPQQYTNPKAYYSQMEVVPSGSTDGHIMPLSFIFHVELSLHIHAYYLPFLSSAQTSQLIKINHLKICTYIKL